MSSKYTRNITKVAVAQVCQTIGWHGIQTTPLEVLTDVFAKYFHELIENVRRHTEFFGRTEPILEDIALAFNACGISVEELEEYVSQVAPVPCSHSVPKYPIERESHLNLLKPGSREVVTRPVHIHEHLPAMHPQLEEEEYSKIVPISVDTNISNANSPESSPKGMFKKPVDPASESLPHKRVRMLAEEEGRPLREISSVMMTTSGFLSPAREGKLPESKALPKLTSQSHDSETTSYPAVPPEVKGDKKHKKISSKQGSSSSKKLFDKEKTKENGVDIKERSDSQNASGEINDTKVKKLAGMKETVKLKAFKSNALKVSQSNAMNDGISQKHKEAGVTQSLQVLLPKLPKTSKSKSPIPAAPKAEVSSDKIKTGDKSKIFEGKLESEPDRQKLNIFKKIGSKPKEDKAEDVLGMGSDRKVDTPSPTPKNRGSPLPSMDTYESLPLPKTPDIVIKTIKPIKAKKTPDDAVKRKRGRPRIHFPAPDGSSPPKPPRKKAKLASPASAEKPKTPNISDDAIFPPVFPFGSSLPRVPGPGLIPHPLLNPLALPGGKNFPPFPAQTIPGLPNVLNPLHNIPITKTEELAPQKIVNVVKSKEKPSPESSKGSGFNFGFEEKPSTVSDKIKDEKNSSPSSGVSSELSFDDKDKNKDHKKDKKHKKRKHKEKLKLKMKEKERLKEARKKEKAEKKLLKKIMKKEQKKKGKKDKVEETNESGVPKITVKLESSPPPQPAKPPTPTPIVEPAMKKIVIKPVMKKDSTESVAVKTEKVVEDVAPAKRSKVKSQKKNARKLEALKGSVVTRQKGSKNDSADPSGAQIWICPACGRQDDGTPMIGCDGCDAWYHWSCLGLKVAPDSTKWFCPVCSILKAEKADKKKKPGRKKKVP